MQELYIANLDLDGRQLRLVVNRQEVESVFDHIGVSGTARKNYTSLFVKTEDDDYTEVWGFRGIVPYLNKKATRIK